MNRRTGIEVHRLAGIGWRVVTTWEGKVLSRERITRTREEADTYARELHEETREGILKRVGEEPYLKLSGGRHETP